MNNLFEGSEIFTGLPNHWIKFLVDRYGSGYFTGAAGEHSKVTKLKQFHPWQIRNALKDSDNIAVIGRIDNEPVFMITKHEDYATKYRIFEVSKDRGSFGSKKDWNTSGRADSFTMNQIIGVIDEMLHNKTFENLTIESISKDPERAEIASKRSEHKKEQDPLEITKEKGYWGTVEHPSISQRERLKKYKELQELKLESKLKKQKAYIKSELNKHFDKAFDEIANNIRSGYTYNVDTRSLGQKLAKYIDVEELNKLAKAYSILDRSLYNKHIKDVIKVIKDLNLK